MPDTTPPTLDYAPPTPRPNLAAPAAARFAGGAGLGALVSFVSLLAFLGPPGDGSTIILAIPVVGVVDFAAAFLAVSLCRRLSNRADRTIHTGAFFIAGCLHVPVVVTLLSAAAGFESVPLGCAAAVLAFVYPVLVPPLLLGRPHPDTP